MSNTVILFLSPYGPEKRETPYDTYTTDKGFEVMGAQTNEAPVLYVIKRLKNEKEKLDRIIALVTPEAKKHAYKHFKDTIKSVSPATVLKSIEVDSVDTTNLLEKTLDALSPLNTQDSIIIETTGGFRNAVNALTLLSRFLRYNGVRVIFSTYSDYQAKRVTDTRDTDDLFDLLDAVNVFATTGNARDIKKLLEKWKMDKKMAFFKATDDFYNSLIICNAPRIEGTIKNLKNAIVELENTEYDTENIKMLIFKKLIMNIIKQKMTFLNSTNYMLDFVKWCNDNNYFQQSVTFLRERIIGENRERIINRELYNTIKLLRNGINHALGKVEYKDEYQDDETITTELINKVNHLLENPNEIKSFVNSVIKKINENIEKRSAYEYA